MEEVKKKIEQLFDQFIQEELGNRLSQFAWLAFKGMVLGELKKLDQTEPIKDE